MAKIRKRGAPKTNLPFIKESEEIENNLSLFGKSASESSINSSDLNLVKESNRVQKKPKINSFPLSVIEAFGDNQENNATENSNLEMSPKSTLLAFKREPAIIQTAKVDKPTVDKPTVDESEKFDTENLVLEMTDSNFIQETGRKSPESHCNSIQETGRKNDTTMAPSSSSLEHKLIEITRQHSDLSLLYQTLTTSLNDANNRFMQYKSQMEQQNAQLQQALDLVISDRENLKIKLASAPSPVVDSTEYQELQGKVQELKAVESRLELELLTAISTIGTLTARVAQMEGRASISQTNEQEALKRVEKANSERDAWVVQLKNQTAVLEQQTELVKKLTEESLDLDKENSSLEAELTQCKAQLERVEIQSKTVIDELEAKLDEEIAFSKYTGNMVELHRCLIGVQVKKYEITKIGDVEYARYVMKQKGLNNKTFSFILLVPTDKALCIKYIPNNARDETLAEWIQEEIDFSFAAARVFFKDLLKALLSDK